MDAHAIPRIGAILNRRGFPPTVHPAYTAQAVDFYRLACGMDDVETIYGPLGSAIFISLAFAFRNIVKTRVLSQEATGERHDPES